MALRRLPFRSKLNFRSRPGKLQPHLFDEEPAYDESSYGDEYDDSDDYEYEYEDENE